MVDHYGWADRPRLEDYFKCKSREMVDSLVDEVSIGKELTAAGGAKQRYITCLDSDTETLTIRLIASLLS